MRGFWGRYELCDHNREEAECDGNMVHFALLEVEYEHVPATPAVVKITNPDVGEVDAIDVRSTRGQPALPRGGSREADARGGVCVAPRPRGAARADAPQVK
jgi:hypothetical protein